MKNALVNGSFALLSDALSLAVRAAVTMLWLAMVGSREVEASWTFGWADSDGVDREREYSIRLPGWRE